jgi:hypothetical protein
MSRQLKEVPYHNGTTYDVVNLSPQELEMFQRGGTFTTDKVTVTAFDLANFKGRWQESNAVIAYTGRSGRDVSPLTESYVHQVYYDRRTSFKVTGMAWDERLKKWVITVEDISFPPNPAIEVWIE